MSIDLQSILAVLGLLGTGIAFMFSRQTVDAMIKLGNWWGEARQRRIDQEQHRLDLEEKRKQLEEDRQARLAALDEEMNDRGYKLVVRRQDRRITELEKDVKESKEENELCRRQYNELTVKHERLQGEHDHLKADYLELKEESSALATRVRHLEGR